MPDFRVSIERSKRAPGFQSGSDGFLSRMDWDDRMSSLLSAADGSMAKMRERFTSSAKFSTGREDLLLVQEMIHNSDLPVRDRPPLPRWRPCPQPPSPPSSPCPAVQRSDMATVQAQLDIQNQAIDVLIQKVLNMESERECQQQQIQTLQGEVQRLREDSKVRDDPRRGRSPGAEGATELWRKGMEQELLSLRGLITLSLGNQDASSSSTLRQKELALLWMNVDQLKIRLKRQEEDMFLLQSEAGETLRRYERSCRDLRIQSFDLAKTVSQHTQQDVRQIRVTLSDLKDKLRNLFLREDQSTAALSPCTSGLAPAPVPSGSNPEVRGQEAELYSNSISTLSLVEISSDYLTWLEDKERDLRNVPPLRLSDLTNPSSDADREGEEEDEEHDDDDDDDDDDNNDYDLLEDDENLWSDLEGSP